ncbi:MAG: FkbM family methyltransferase [Nitrososphaerales archaeon]
MVKLIPSNIVTIPTPYGKFYMPKTARVISTMLDLIEPQVQSFFTSFIKTTQVFIDVGAAYGWYTLKAARLMKDGVIISIEPDEYTYTILKANIRTNRLRNVIPIKAALANKNGYVMLGGKQIPCRKLDELLDELSISINKHESLIKIDVEGMALEVLGGANETIEKRRPKLIIELHEGEEKVPIVLKNLSYNVLNLPGNMLIAY